MKRSLIRLSSLPTRRVPLTSYLTLPHLPLTPSLPSQVRSNRTFATVADLKLSSDLIVDQSPTVVRPADDMLGFELTSSTSGGGGTHGVEEHPTSVGESLGRPIYLVRPVPIDYHGTTKYK